MIQPSSKLASNKRPKAESVTKYSRCPYHEPVVQLVSAPMTSTRGRTGIDRFLDSEPEQQSTIFLRPDDGLCTLANCTCERLPEQSAPKL